LGQPFLDRQFNDVMSKFHPTYQFNANFGNANVMNMIHQQPVEFGSESHDLPVRIIPNRWKVVSRLCPYMQPLQKQVRFLCVIKKQRVYKYKT